jgi:hypothetical protein
LVDLVKKGENWACLFMIPDHAREGDHRSGAWISWLGKGDDGILGKKNVRVHSASGYRGKYSHIVLRVQFLARLKERAVFRDATGRL